MHISTRNKITYFGFKRFCPICRSRVRYFLPFGEPQRTNALCPVCHSLERHRLAWLFCKNRTGLFTQPMSFLHLAPENCLVRRLQKLPNLRYASIDYASQLAGVRMDVTELGFPTDTFTAIYGSHLLEHVPNDTKALAELFRVLQPGGWAVLMVPLSGAVTREDIPVADEQERADRYGQGDHVRIYGSDFSHRLRAAGFTVDVIDYCSAYNPRQATSMGLTNDLIFYCQK